MPGAVPITCHALYQSVLHLPDGDITLIILFWRKNERFRDVR